MAPILVRNGKNCRKLERALHPAGANVIDATGLFVMPGIIRCHSPRHLAVEGGVNEGKRFRFFDLQTFRDIHLH